MSLTFEGKMNIVRVIAIIIFLIDIILVAYIFKFAAVPALIAFLIALSGPLLTNHYLMKIINYLKLDVPITENMKFLLKYHHEVNTLTILSFSTVGIGWFVIMFYMVKEPLIFSIMSGIITSLPMLSIGLRWNCFNDKNRKSDTKELIGYPPFFYLVANIIVCWIGYESLFFITSIEDGMNVFLICTFCFVWIVFPDKFNKILPFDNRTTEGFFIYLGFIIALFVILMKGYIPPEIMDVIRN